MTKATLAMTASLLTTTLMLSACAPATEADTEPQAEVETITAEPTVDSAAVLQTVLDAQDEEAKARYDARNPAETLAFFGIEPGMAVGEALPGGGWYTKILLPYLGDDGRLVGVDYSLAMWPEFGGFADDEFIEGKKTWPETWTADAQSWTEADVDVDAYTFATLPEDGSLDAFLFIRAMHNLSRFEDNGNYMTDAIAKLHGALKPGGIVGVVQHAAPDSADAEWASGSAGYLRPMDVIAAFEAAGFEFVESSDINANPMDNPTTDDMVWRLPPTLGTSREDPELREQMQSIGESNRMTLKFRKV